MIWPRGGWRDLGGVILTAWSWQRDLEGAISPAHLVLGRDLAHPLYSLFLLFFSLSLGVCESGNDLKVKQKVNHFLGQRPYFTVKVIYFPENFAVGCKMNSGNHLHPKQMHPKLQTRFLRDTTFQLVTNKEDRNIRIFQYSPAEQKTNT